MKFAIVAGAAVIVGVLIGYNIEKAPERYPQCYEDEVAMRDQVPGAWECVPRDSLVIEIDSRTGKPIGD